jgi:hypothetical protein
VVTPIGSEPAWIALNPVALSIKHGVRKHARSLLG